MRHKTFPVNKTVMTRTNRSNNKNGKEIADVEIAGKHKSV